TAAGVSGARGTGSTFNGEGRESSRPSPRTSNSATPRAAAVLGGASATTGVGIVVTVIVVAVTVVAVVLVPRRRRWRRRGWRRGGWWRKKIAPFGNPLR